MSQKSFNTQKVKTEEKLHVKQHDTNEHRDRFPLLLYVKTQKQSIDDNM